MGYDVDEQREIDDEKMKVGKWLDKKMEKALANGIITQEEAKIVNKMFSRMTKSKYDDFWYDHAHEKAKEVIYDVMVEYAGSYDDSEEVDGNLIRRIEEA